MSHLPLTAAASLVVLSGLAFADELPQIEVKHASPLIQTIERPAPANFQPGLLTLESENGHTLHGQVNAVQKGESVLRLVLPPDFPAGTFSLSHAAPPLATDAPGFSSAHEEGKITVSRSGDADAPPTFSFQAEPLAAPDGGPRYAGSSFIHPFTTPGGHPLTMIQPGDHRHHFGVWWPWKYLDVGDSRHNTWEIQNNQGRLVCREVRPWHGPVAAGLEAANMFEVIDGRGVSDAVAQYASISTWQHPAHPEGGRHLDIRLLDHAVADQPVVAPNYRYSGFALRGPQHWTAANSTILTSAGHDRDSGHATQAEWVLVNAVSEEGTDVSVLMLSRAASLHGNAEHLRLWGSDNNNGRVFINFNPVAREPLALPTRASEAFERNYRLVASDRHLTAEEATAIHRAWIEPPALVTATDPAKDPAP